MKEYQQRVIDEQLALEDKAKKLTDFISLNPVFLQLDPNEQERLRIQNEIMWQYYEILGKRIANF